MHLKSLEIQGFKSFPERTVIEFHEGMTAIVGPNGSGKSNITDAIRWVLGEQSVKTLRGRKMEDLIFSGTETRRPLSYAEVNITFTNEKSELDLPYEEIIVSRRLYRSGESEYRINKSLCRLRDVVDLFLDTGVGRDGYSIIGQGRVDELLSNKSEDRRRVFEEAAGITKLRIQKEETLKKLEQTEQNLVRIEDIIVELEHQLNPLAEQAEVAKKYLQVLAEVRSLDLTVAHKQIAAWNEENAQLSLNQANTDQDIAELANKLADLENNFAEELKLFNENEQAQLNLEKNKNIWHEQKLRLSNEKTAKNAQKLAIEQTLAGLKKRAIDDESGLIKLEAEVAEQNKKFLDIKVVIEDLTLELQAKQTELQSADAVLMTKSQEKDELQKQILQSREDLYQKKTLAANAGAELNAFAKLQELQKTEENEVSLHTEQLLLDNRTAEANLAMAELEVKVAEAKQVEAEADLNDAKEILSSTENNLNDLLNQEKEANFRFNTLQELGKSYEGYSHVVQNLLSPKGIDATAKKGVFGTVAELIDVPAEYDVAIEVALGAALQNIVVAGESDAARLIEYLKKNKIGRATFLPLDALQVRTLPTHIVRKIEDVQGFVGIAADLVGCNGELKLMVEFLLNNVIVAENLAAARFMAGLAEHKIKIVTLDGELLSPGGALSGGSLQQKRPKLLSRTRDLNDLKRKLQTLPEQIKEINTTLKQQRNELLQSGQNFANVQAEFQEAQKRLILCKAGFEELQRQLLAGQARLAKIKQDLAEQSAKKEVFIQSEQENLAAAEAVKLQLEKLQANLQNQDIIYTKEMENVAGLKSQVQELQGKLQAAEEVRKNALAWQERLENEKKSQHERLKNYQTETERCRNELANLVEQEKILGEKLVQLELEGEDLQKQAQELAVRREKNEKNKDGIQNMQRELQQQTLNLKMEAERWQNRIERLADQRNELLNNIWENYEITLAQVKEEDLCSTDLALSTLQKHLNTAKQNLRNFGAVNLNAVEEYEAVSDRYNFLTTQRDDITNARKGLDGVIKDLQNTMQAKFSASFAQINQNFNSVFNSLFGGGKAEVILENSEDVLNSVIEIKAQPPGKRLQNMLLLSGGERSLTAIALLFAILNLRTTPFVVLDEIEAALDDANVLRFNDYVREHSDRSQFILVTHRKGTMEACNRIYGVTMQERGISRVLSMQLTATPLVDSLVQ